jgi:uncharacterized protein YbjT (DUF2867 family)
MKKRSVFITGGTGYVGQRLIPRLIERGHEVKALVRPGSECKLPSGSQRIVGNALDAGSFAARISPADTFIQLVGVAHPSPSKAAQFKAIDLVSGRASVSAAAGAGVSHFVYVSVAQPAPVMKEYQAVRCEVETMIGDSGIAATILRPWYVLGPGHRWPHALIPAYWLFERISATRETASRLGLVTLDEMVNALIAAAEAGPTGVRIMDVPAIRAACGRT